MPSNAQKGARSKLADVLADIKNSRTEDGSESIHNTRPTPAKRRSAVNYVALSGHTPRQSRSSAAFANQSNSSDSKATASPSKAKSYVLKFVDYTIDLGPFLNKSKNGGADYKEPSLYPLVREWTQVNSISKDPVNNHQENAQQKPTKSEQPPPTDESLTNDNTTQPDPPHHGSNKALSRQPRAKKQKVDVDTICRNLSLAQDQRHLTN